MIRYASCAACAATVPVLLALTGCASILGGGSNEPVRVTSTPSGATVAILDDKGKQVHAGVTPYIVNLNRGDGWFTPAKYTARASADGFPTRDAKFGPG